MISNPCTWFTTDSNEESFTYEGGKYLFHFSDRDNKLSTTFSINVMFFADDEKHGLDILKRMLEFRINCCEQSLKHIVDDRHGFAETTKNNIKKSKKMIVFIKKGKVKLTKAPTNMFFKVAWADNDTI